MSQYLQNETNSFSPKNVYEHSKDDIHQQAVNANKNNNTLPLVLIND
jgi:hypothetical protein